MQTADLVARLRDEILNRPADDDLFADPAEYHAALTRAQAYWYRQAATHYPDLFVQEEGPIATDDDGRTYSLDDDHYGEIELWTPPGPPTGQPILPARPEARRFGFYVEGREIKLTLRRTFTPGIYVRWTPATVTPVDGEDDPVLPAYFEDALLYRAAYHLAAKPGFMGDPEFYRIQAMREWEGDPDSISDAGILGTLSRQSAHGGFETIGDDGLPWYKRIGT